MRGRGRLLLPFIAGVLAVVVVLAAVAVIFVLPEVQKVKAEVVRFQKAAQIGRGAFTAPTDVSAVAQAAQAGGAGAALTGGGSAGGATPTSGGGDGGQPAPPTGGQGGEPKPGTFGGSGSDRVCDREKLIKYLLAKPERLRAWAKTLGIEATPEAIAAFIRKLRPVTLTRDTQVTNHAYKDGKATAYQAIMQKGTAVLVDKDGKPVTRCRCGNPLTEPIELEEKPKCIDCPANYKPPPPCDYYNYDDAKYQRYDDQDFKRDYESGKYEDTCYRPDPDPPPVDEEPPTTDDCAQDPTAAGCEQRCADDPSLPYCDGQETPPGGQETPPGGEEAPPGGEEALPDGQGAPSDGGVPPSDGGGSPPVGDGAPSEPQQ